MSKQLGSMVCRQRVFLYDWVIPDFLKWTDSKSPSDFLIGPDFVVNGKAFYIQLVPADIAASFRIWLIKKTEGSINFDQLSFSLVSNDGQELEIGSQNKVTFNKSNTLLNSSQADGEFQKSYLHPKFLHNHTLCIRCQIQIESTEEKKQENQIQDCSLVDDLSLQLAEQSSSFCDTILSCGGKEIPVHRFMLAARSPVFKAMFSHDETTEGQKGKVE
jgi:hypothetical protein